MTTGASPHLRTPFGLKSGKMVAPAEVESGLACDCVCLGCGASLVAKKGPKIAWHFAHHVVLASQSCVETAIHAAAKQVLLEQNWLQIPEKTVTVTGRTKYGTSHSKSVVLKPARTIRFDYSREEMWEAGSNIRPDVIGYRGDRRFLVEMFLTHQVDEAKRKKLATLGLPAIEINLSNLGLVADFEAIRQRVLHDLPQKEWLFHPGEEEAKAALRIDLRGEIDELNRAHDDQQAAQQRKEEARLREAERIRQAIVDANERYRLLPQAEKERILREALHIKSSWPYYLNRSSPEASAIAEPVRIWQAALFSRFIFGKAGADAQLQVDTLHEWVIGRFGLVDNRSSDALTAVKKFLGHLRACGFLEKSPYNPYETPYYEIVHDGLVPPPKPPKREPSSFTPAPTKWTTVANGRVGSEPIGRKPHWLWRASWPGKHEMLEASATLLEASPYKEPLLRVIEALSPQSRPNEPLASALPLEAQGVPRDVTLDVFVKLGLALKTSVST